MTSDPSPVTPPERRQGSGELTEDHTDKVSALLKAAEELVSAPLFKFEATQGSEGARQIEWIARARQVISDLKTALEAKQDRTEP